MKEEIRKMDQAVASSSKFMKEFKGADTQYIAMRQATAGKLLKRESQRK